MTPGAEIYFERELAFLLQHRDGFQRRYPAEAGRLTPDKTRVPDPHLERFIEGFAALAARVQRKLDSDLPELTESLLQVFYPHLIRPIPSMAIAQLQPRTDVRLSPAGERFERGTALASRPIGDPPFPVRWRTGYPVTLWPVDLVEAQVLRGPFPGAPPRTVAALRLHFACRDGRTFADLELDRLRFHLSGEKQAIASLYEILFLNCTRVTFRALDQKKPALHLDPAQCLHPVGFDADEALVPMPPESFAAQGLLMEFLSFPQKFHFIDLSGWREAKAAGFGAEVEVVFFLTRIQDAVEQSVHSETFLQGCTPVVNLFPQSAEPVPVTHLRTEYRLVPTRMAQLAVEVFTIDSVEGVEEGREAFPVRPFYHYALGQTRDLPSAFWHASRRASFVEGDRGTEVYLTLSDGQWDPAKPSNLMLDVRTTCTNRDYPRHLRGGSRLRVEGEAGERAGEASLLTAPTDSLRPPLRGAAHWRLLSQLGLNHKTLTDPVSGVAALQEALRLVDFSDPDVESLLRAVNRQVVEGIAGLKTRRVLGRASSGGAMGLCRGLEVTLELNEKSYVGIGMYLFACVLERYLGWAAGLNSFVQLAVRTVQGDFIKKWPPRAADRQLL